VIRSASGSKPSGNVSAGRAGVVVVSVCLLPARRHQRHGMRRSVLVASSAAAIDYST
jgi:hypothetical protein